MGEPASICSTFGWDKQTDSVCQPITLLAGIPEQITETILLRRKLLLGRFDVLLIVNDNAAPAKNRSRGGAIRIIDLVVVDNGIAVVLVPDFDPELVRLTATVNLSI